MHSNKIPVHTIVRVKYDAANDKEYYACAHRRKNLHNTLGAVIGFSDSHGLCYHVENADFDAWFEPNELIIEK